MPEKKIAAGRLGQLLTLTALMSSLEKGAEQQQQQRALISPHPDIFAHCGVNPLGQYRCNYSRTNKPFNRGDKFPTHTYKLKKTVGVRGYQTTNKGCPTNLNNSNASQCAQNAAQNTQTFQTLKTSKNRINNKINKLRGNIRSADRQINRNIQEAQKAYNNSYIAWSKPYTKAELESSCASRWFSSDECKVVDMKRSKQSQLVRAEKEVNGLFDVTSLPNKFAEYPISVTSPWTYPGAEFSDRHPGFRFPTRDEMIELAKKDPNAPSPDDPPSIWSDYIQGCLANSKCLGLGLLLAILNRWTHVEVGEKREKNMQKLLEKEAREERRRRNQEATARQRQQQHQQRAFQPKRGGATRKIRKH